MEICTKLTTDIYQFFKLTVVGCQLTGGEFTSAVKVIEFVWTKYKSFRYLQILLIGS